MSGHGRVKQIAKRSRTGEGSSHGSSRSLRDRALSDMCSEHVPYFEKLCGMNMLQEKGVPQSLVDQVPGLHYLFDRESWGHLFAFAGAVDIEAVREFYARATTKNGGIEVSVRGKVFMITPDYLSQLLGVVELPRYSPDYIDEYTALMRHPEQQWRRLVGDRLLPPGSALPNHTQSTSLLPTDAKILYHIISHTLMPTKDPRKIVPLRLALIYSIMENRSLNVGHFLFQELEVAVRERKLRILLYPMIVTSICQANGVRVVPTHSPIKFKLLDLNKILGVDRQQAAQAPEEEEMDDHPVEGSSGRGYAPPEGLEGFMAEARAEWGSHRAFYDSFVGFQHEQQGFQQERREFEARQEAALARQEAALARQEAAMARQQAEIAALQQQQQAYHEETLARMHGLEDQFHNWSGFYQPPPQDD